MDLHPFILPLLCMNTTLLFELHMKQRAFAFTPMRPAFISWPRRASKETGGRTCKSHPFSPLFSLGWYEGERLRDGERGWFLAECGAPITCAATIERNVQRMDRLKGLETNV